MLSFLYVSHATPTLVQCEAKKIPAGILIESGLFVGRRCTISCTISSNNEALFAVPLLEYIYIFIYVSRIDCVIFFTSFDVIMLILIAYISTCDYNQYLISPYISL